MSELVTEKIVETEQIVEKMDEDAEQIGYSPEIISEIMPEKKRYRGQRWHDKAPRRINRNSMMNLKPYRDKPIAIEESKNVQVNNRTITDIGIVLLLAASAIIAWKAIKWWKENRFAEQGSAFF